MNLYIGPGISAATFIIVAIILGIVLLSLAIVLIRPIKRLIRKFKKTPHGK